MIHTQTKSSYRKSGNRVFGALLAAAMLMLVRPAVVSSFENDEFIQRWQIDQQWKGDFDGMVKRRMIRVLVVHNDMLFFFDKATIRGITYEGFREFEKYINKKLKTGTRKIRVVFLPVPRDRLLPWLAEGRGDIAAANLTITKKRLELIDFTNPVITDINEILVTGPAASPVSSIESLSGRKVHVRQSSSYYEHLNKINSTLKRQGKKPLQIVAASEYFEDSDLLEMVNAGLLPKIVVDDHKARFWVQIFDKVTLHPEIAINKGGKIAWGIRHNSPKLKQTLNEFIKNYKKGTLLGNILFKRYLVDNKWARNSLSPKELKKFENTVSLIQKYSEKYDFDYLMVSALAYQESRLDQSSRSPAGAVGIMQLLPSTAADKNVGIKGIDKLENNIHAGVKYLHFLRDRYFSDPAIDPLNRNLLTFAAYNAGPAKITRMRKEARQMGLNPNVWFDNVEIAAAKRIGRETVQYVSNIYKYYVAYSLARIKSDVRQKQVVSP